MEDYPSMPLYRGEDIDALKRVVDPKLCIVLPGVLWNADCFRRLPAGAKLLYGIIASKLASNDVSGEPGKPAGIVLPFYRIMKLLGCSQRSVFAYLRDLADSGLIAREITYDVRGRGMHTHIYMQQNSNTNGTAVIVIPISMFFNEDFKQLPDGAKLMYGVMFANMANGKGYSDPMGNYYQFLPAGRFTAYCMLTKMTFDKYMRALCDAGLVYKMRLKAKGKRGKNIDLLYIGRLV